MRFVFLAFDKVLGSELRFQGFRVSGFWVWGLGLGVSGFGLGVRGFGLRVSGLGFRAEG